MTREEAHKYIDDYVADNSLGDTTELVDIIYDDFESRTCENCIDFIDGICTDVKGHYCIRGINMEDRYTEREAKK